MIFAIGQRWISNSEAKLGLGIVTLVEGRHVQIRFPAAEEERSYAADNAPLSRIIYKKGELISTATLQNLEVTDVQEDRGVLIYTAMDEEGHSVRISEVALDCFINVFTPQQRFFSYQTDKLSSFKLRIDTLNHFSRLQQSSVRGLLGSRTNHLAHQVYIAHEVAQRYAPRVLLADEVGLGKTIEAGMILHYQLYTGRAKRVLIVVPNNLIHQWLVEMIRRFNLNFSIIDESYFDAHDNPFAHEQLALCSLDFLTHHQAACEQASTCTWDLVIIDEAHHLFWSECEVSREYKAVESLAQCTKGLLLLTATPEQIGVESHFARLKLLDPHRFHDLETFKKEEVTYQALNNLVQALLTYQQQPTSELSTELQQAVSQYLGTKTDYTDINQIIANLLDYYGTGRILFRNTRMAIKGFPERCLTSYPLEQPLLYKTISGSSALYPELIHEAADWLLDDPRVSWLISQVKLLYPKKVLIICANDSTAVALENHFKMTIGIRSTSFHRELSLIERDRAAAYFAEQENGAQVLICSEIGSEGRNFQFAHHLILFDLPLNPDLLEQRIGRLDRIGQQHPIAIHVPYIKSTAQEVLFRWYHEGINLFEKSCSVGFSIFSQFSERLLLIMETLDNDLLQALIDDTKMYTEKMTERLEEGRDRLLELNSCNYPKAQELIAAIEDEENSLELESYMADVFQEYGVDHEHHSPHTDILTPSNHMKTTYFPGLKEDGMTITYLREKALVREDMSFLSWEHPMVSEAMDMILESEVGNVTMSTIAIKGLPTGMLFLETIHTVHCPAPSYLGIEQYIPLTPIRCLVDINGKDFSTILGYERLNKLCESIKRYKCPAIIKQIRDDIEHMLKHSNQLVSLEKNRLVEQGKLLMQNKLNQEINRLDALKAINPAIRPEEIDFFRQLIGESDIAINNAALNLQAMRVVINNS